MKAKVFHDANDIRVEEVSRPHAGIGEAVIRVTLTTICGTDLHIVRGERIRRLLTLVQSGRFDPTPLITHRFSLDEIPQAYQLFGERSDDVLKVAIKP
jgi:threonine dehydrogenase-like Zn-dependent dehydrogenase